MVREKVLIIHHGRGIGGALTAMIGLIDELHYNFDIQVLCIFNSDAIEELRSRNIDVIRPKSKFYDKWYRIFVHSEANFTSLWAIVESMISLFFYILNTMFFVSKELKSIDYDIIYLNSLFLSDWLKKDKRKKIIVHVREPLSNGSFGIRKKIIINKLKKIADKIIAINYDNAKRIDLKEKTVVVYDPVILNMEFDHKLPSSRKFIYLGGNQKIKGADQFVDALALVDKRIQILVLGNFDIKLKNSFRSIVKIILNISTYINSKKFTTKLENNRNISYFGLVSDPSSFYRQSTFLICPFSKPHGSLTILEAFSIGMPVIVSDIEGMDEFVSSDNGCFFENGNAIDLAEKINYMYNISNEELLKYRLAAYNKYLRVYSNNNSVENVLLALN